VAQLWCLGDIWVSVLTRRRSRRLWAGVAFLAVEGAALIVGHGDCPVGPMQAEWGDPVPFFELVLPPRAAKAAVPVLAVVSLVGIAALALRRPGLVARAWREGTDDRRQDEPGLTVTQPINNASRSVDGRDAAAGPSC
jgi:hypothetical protein